MCIVIMTVHQVLRLLILPAKLRLFIFTTIVILSFGTHPVNFLSGRRPGRPEKTHYFRQDVDRLFSHESTLYCARFVLRQICANLRSFSLETN